MGNRTYMFWRCAKNKDGEVLIPGEIYEDMEVHINALSESMYTNAMDYSNYYPHPPFEEPWNFQGRGCINLGISRGGSTLTLEFPGKGLHYPWDFLGRGCINPGISWEGGALTLGFPGKGASRLWNSKGRSNSHMEFPEGEVNFIGWKFHGRTYVRRKFPGVNVPWWKFHREG
jgi:hypothetical protein